MGAYRFLLAVLVLISHTELRLAHFNVGVFAVVSFLILSGYVMTLLVRRHYATPDKLPMFYLDRAGRIFPQFIFYLVLTIVLVSQRRIAYDFVKHCGPYAAALNALALPLSWSRLLGLDCQYLPQAWSLGLELSFYLLVPFLIYRPRLAWTVAPLSLGVFIAALTMLIDTETYAYRTLPGTLFIFMVGMSLASRNLLSRVFPIFIWVVAVGLLAILYAQPRLWQQPFSKEILVGLLIGVPLIALMKDRRPTQLDELLGNISYGLFLNHVLFICVLQQIAGVGIASYTGLFFLVDVCTLAAYLTYRLIENPVLHFRRRLRGDAIVREPSQPVWLQGS